MMRPLIKQEAKKQPKRVFKNLRVPLNFELLGAPFDSADEQRTASEQLQREKAAFEMEVLHVAKMRDSERVEHLLAYQRLQNEMPSGQSPGHITMYTVFS